MVALSGLTMVVALFALVSVAILVGVSQTVELALLMSQLLVNYLT